MLLLAVVLAYALVVGGEEERIGSDNPTGFTLTTGLTVGALVETAVGATYTAGRAEVLVNSS